MKRGTGAEEGRNGDARLLCAATQIPMRVFLRFSQLQHVAENRDRAALLPRERLQRRERGLHRRGRGVVAVVEDRETLSAPATMRDRCA